MDEKKTFATFSVFAKRDVHEKLEYMIVEETGLIAKLSDRNRHVEKVKL